MESLLDLSDLEIEVSARVRRDASESGPISPLPAIDFGVSPTQANVT
jgi:hypothetical protein